MRRDRVRGDLWGLVILADAAASGCGGGADRFDVADVIEYRGEKIKLTKSYADYEDYEEEPEISGRSLEVPHAGKDRILVFRSNADGFDRIDDFVMPCYDSAQGRIVSVALADGKLLDSDLSKRPVLTRKLAKRPR